MSSLCVKNRYDLLTITEYLRSFLEQTEQGYYQTGQGKMRRIRRCRCFCLLLFAKINSLYMLQMNY